MTLPPAAIGPVVHRPTAGGAGTGGHRPDAHRTLQHHDDGALPVRGAAALPDPAALPRAAVHVHAADGSAAGDEGTNALVSGYITEQEKDVWMYNAYLG